MTARPLRTVLRLCALAALAGAVGCSSLTTTTPALTVGPPALDFGRSATDLPLGLQLAGDRTEQMRWRVVETPPWAQVSPAEGAGSALLTVSVRRTGCGTGDQEGIVRIEGPGGTTTVAVRMFVGGG